jgi:lipid-binding SYLF domain-containing protein
MSHDPFIADASFAGVRASRRLVVGASLGAIAGLGLWPAAASAASASELTRDGSAALQQLYAQNDKAREVGRRARAILVFPGITKAGFMVGGQGGNGVLFMNGRAAGFFSIYAGSFGLQIGAQKFSYALFFMTQSALDYLRSSKGWAIGSGPSIAVIDQGAAKTMNTTTLKKDVYAFPFGQKGLMAGLGLEGSKITPIHPDA